MLANNACDFWIRQFFNECWRKSGFASTSRDMYKDEEKEELKEEKKEKKMGVSDQFF